MDTMRPQPLATQNSQSATLRSGGCFGILTKFNLHNLLEAFPFLDISLSSRLWVLVNDLTWHASSWTMPRSVGSAAEARLAEAAAPAEGEELTLTAEARCLIGFRLLAAGPFLQNLCASNLYHTGVVLLGM